jgi:hypothetical protein
MRVTVAQIRQIVREELIRLHEGRSNTFMASRMEETELDEQDRDGDGDEDFNDVRVARFTASGMSKDKAVARVKKKPLGKAGAKKQK